MIEKQFESCVSVQERIRELEKYSMSLNETANHNLEMWRIANEEITILKQKLDAYETQAKTALDTVSKGQIGHGDDPIGFILAAYPVVCGQLEAADGLEHALIIAKRDFENWISHDEAREGAIACADKYLSAYQAAKGGGG